MTAVLSMSDILRKDRHMSMDDFPPDTDWREKYNEVVDMLAETRAELDDFHQASKELEAELESELQRTEKAQKELQAKVIKAENERDEWKNKFMSLQTTHNTTTTSLQRELDQLRQEHQKTKVYIRELEMGNDDLERNERAVSSSLADMESKYTKVLEEKILLEHELLEKAGLEEDTQRLKDELRDCNVEISILKDQLVALSSQQKSQSESHLKDPSAENLLKMPPPPDLDLDDVSPSSEESSLRYQDTTITNSKAPLSRPAVPASFMLRTETPPKSSAPVPLKTTTNLMRSNTLPVLPSPTTTPRGIIRPPAARSTSTATTSSAGSTTKNKGVQMVSEMRARVRNLEQKIHTRVPRLRMASITGRQSALSNTGTSTPISSSSSVTSNASTAKTSWESQRKSAESRRSNDSELDKKAKKDTNDSSGWVLIMEDSPSPQKDKEAKKFRDKRRLSNPTITPLFRPASSIRAPSPSVSTGMLNAGSNPLAVSTGLRLPRPRLSGGNGVGQSSSSVSRPQTPTFLPIPSSNLQASTSGIGLKRSTGPSAPNPYNGQLKRSSFSKGNVTPPVPPLPPLHRERPITMPPINYKRDSGASSPLEAKDLPSLPNELTSNITMRSTNRIPASTTSTSTISVLSKSRIGRPSGGGFSGRKSGDALDISDLQPRSGKSAGG